MASEPESSPHTGRFTDGLDSGRNGRKSRAPSEIEDEYEADNSEKKRGPNRKTSYALVLQKACSTVIRNIAKDPIITSSSWADPLAAAPAAISTMAILFKIADQDCAAALKVTSLDVMDVERRVVRGKLPSEYFRSNLQYCSDVGRMAFLEAQHGMNTIRATSQTLIDEEGSIGYVLDLLEDPDDARYNLKPELEAIKRSAAKCLAIAKDMTAKFEYWHLLIMHLNQTSLSLQGEVRSEQLQTVEKRRGAELTQDALCEEKLVLESQIRERRKVLADAKSDAERARRQVDKLHSKDVTEPSVIDEQIRLEDRYSQVKLAPKERGAFVRLGDWLMGQSESDAKEDNARQAAHDEVQKQRLEAALKSAHDQREQLRKKAADGLKKAEEREERAKEDLTDAIENLANQKFQLAEAKSNFEKTLSELAMLSEKEVELSEIKTILETSTQRLATLKQQIEEVVVFFKAICERINQTVDTEVSAFLRPIINGMSETGTADEVEALKLGRTSKRRIMSIALQLQCRFSEIADISSAYVAVSTKYIRPAINQIEELANLRDAQWQVKRVEFEQWLRKSHEEIGELTRQASTNIDPNMYRNLEALKQRAIDAAGEWDA